MVPGAMMAAPLARAPSEEALAKGAAVMAPGAVDWIGLFLVSFVLPALLSWFFCEILRKIGWIKEGDLVLPD